MKTISHRWLLMVLSFVMLIVVFGVITVTPVAAAYLLVDDTSGSLNYSYSASPWTQSNINTAVGGSVHTSCTALDTIELAFTGTTITMFYSMRPAGGVVRVYIDGKPTDKLDTYAAEARRQIGKTYTTYGSGSHTIKAEVEYSDVNPRYCFEFDAFVVDIGYSTQGTYDATYPPVGLGTSVDWYYWPSLYDPPNYTDFYGGRTRYSNQGGPGGPLFRVNFVGDSLVWYFTKAANRGMVAVTIDGEDWGVKDLYSATTLRHQTLTFSRLGAGVHHLTVQNIGQKNPASSGYSVDVDQIDIGAATSTYNHTMAGAYADTWAHGNNWWDGWPYMSSFWAGSTDCTNFASQVMLYGGFPLVLGANDNYHWWYNGPSQSQSSNTWRLTLNLYQYMNTRPSEFSFGPVYSGPGYPINYQIRRGDIIYMDLYHYDQNGEQVPGAEGIVDHMRVATGRGYNSPYLLDTSNPNAYIFGSLIDQHSTDRWHAPIEYNVQANNNWQIVYINK